MRLLLVYAGAFAAGVALCSEPAVIGNIVNADLLLPAALSHDLWHGHAALFELARTPSLVPDLAVYLAIASVFSDWRLVGVLYAAVMLTGMVAVLGGIVAAVSGRALAVATGWTLAAAVAAMGADLAWFGAMNPTVLVFAPVVHAGSTLLAFAGLLLVARRMRGGGWGMEAALFGLTAAGTVSDRLFVGTFVLPVILTVALTQPRRLATRIAASVALGCAAGWWLDDALFPGLLLREGDAAIGLFRLPRHLARLVESPTLLPVLTIEAALLTGAWVGWRRFGVGLFWVGTLGVMTVGHTVFYAVQYVDDSLLRYMQPVFWWSVVAIAAVATRFGPAPWVVAAGLVAALMLREARRAEAIPAALAWRSPLAACLRTAQAAGRIHDGLAEYWVARPLEAASRWMLQVDQVLPDGTAFAWGNNRFWFTHARTDPQVSPRTDFIVMDRLDRAAITARFGPPDAVLPCPGSDVWVYAQTIHEAVGGLGGMQPDHAVGNVACIRARTDTEMAAPCR